MTTIYEHMTGTSRIEAVERWDGGADIMMTCGIGTTHEVMMRHPLPINECDKFGAALCKHTIENYRKHTHQLCARIDYLEAINGGLNSDVSRLRMANALYRKRWNEHNDDAQYGSYGIYISIKED